MKTADAVASRPVELWMIEDNHAFRNTVARLLNQTKDIRCTRTFPACEDVLALLNTGATVDVMLLDVELSGMNGIEGLKKIKAISPATRVIMLTVFEDHERVFRAICAGASGYLLKRHIAEKLPGSLEEVLAGGAPMSPSIARMVIQSMQTGTKLNSDPYQLTAREKEILSSLSKGNSYKLIAAEMEISLDTVRTHIKHIYDKLIVQKKYDCLFLFCVD